MHPPSWNARLQTQSHLLPHAKSRSQGRSEVKLNEEMVAIYLNGLLSVPVCKNTLHSKGRNNSTAE